MHGGWVRRKAFRRTSTATVTATTAATASEATTARSAEASATPTAADFIGHCVYKRSPLLDEFSRVLIRYVRCN